MFCISMRPAGSVFLPANSFLTHGPSCCSSRKTNVLTGSHGLLPLSCISRFWLSRACRLWPFLSCGGVFWGALVPQVT